MATLVPVLAAAGSLVPLGVVLFLGGTAIAPALGALYGAVAQRAPRHRRAEAFGWQSTASMTGSALAAPGGGFCLDRFGPAAGAAVAAVALAGAVAVVIMAGVAGPDIPHRAARS